MVVWNSRNPLRSHILLCSLLVNYFLLAVPHHATALSFNLTNIGPQDLNVNIITHRDAYISTQGIQLASVEGSTDVYQKAGRATYIKPLHLWDKTSRNLTDFNTYFLFVIDSDRSLSYADGLAFFLAPEGSNITAGGAMGLPIDPRTIQPTSQFVAVEFDTFYNSWDPNITQVTHVGINFNSLKSNATAVWYSNIPDGIQNEAWISYDSSSKNLSVSFTGSVNNTRVESGLSFSVDLRDYLPEWVTIGFSAATGALFEKHNVRSWQFNSNSKNNVR